MEESQNKERSTDIRPAILVVDDEAHVRLALGRTLGSEYEVLLAEDGSEALDLLATNEVAVVVSDMRMPGMDGAAFFEKAKELYPRTVRVLLTGFADMESATRSINEGAVFRFLSKPIHPTELRRVIGEAIDYHELLEAENRLLSQTLAGAIDVLNQVLEIVSPVAFGRASRIQKVVKHMSRELPIPSPWKIETAAILSQLGCVSLSPELLERVYGKAQLSSEESERFDKHPGIAASLLSNVPRLEDVASIIGKHLTIVDTLPPKNGRVGNDLAAEVLWVADQYDRLANTGMGHGAAKSAIGREIRSLSPGVFDALMSLKPPSRDEAVLSITLKELTPGMVFLDDVREARGTLILAAGHVATSVSVNRLKEMATTRFDIIQPFRVRRGAV